MRKIYKLVDPRDSRVRYVGQTSVSLKRRLIRHVTDAKHCDTYKDRWLKQLLALNLRPNIILIEEVDNSIWEERERFWIASYRQLGCKLTNTADGGEMGIPKDAIIRGNKKRWENESYRQAHSGTNHHMANPKLRQQISQKLVGRSVPKDIRVKISETMTGRHQSLQHTTKISEALTGKKKSYTHRSKLAESKWSLSKEQRYQVYHLRVSSASVKDIAEQFNVSTSVIYRAIKFCQNQPRVGDNVNSGRRST